ncbi:MAG: hypothetical protein UHD09_00945 [Bifidobacterium sp.]|nr:hypothetical protein [Bifidobacterium sp.]
MNRTASTDKADTVSVAVSNLNKRHFGRTFPGHGMLTAFTQRQSMGEPDTYTLSFDNGQPESFAPDERLEYLRNVRKR